MLKVFLSWSCGSPVLQVPSYFIDIYQVSFGGMFFSFYPFNIDPPPQGPIVKLFHSLYMYILFQINLLAHMRLPSKLVSVTSLLKCTLDF